MNRSRTISRRGFAQLLGAAAAAAVVRPALSLAREPATTPPATGVVRLSSNENPYGPSPSAFKAMTEAFDLAWRYPDEQNDALIDGLAASHGVDHAQILLGDGSTEILKICAETFTGPNQNLVAAEPTFEALPKFAKTAGAQVIKVPLTSTFTHDLPKMAAAANRGLIYICNPNNPTASITPKEPLREFISKAPREVTILVDEAYFHFADDADYESVIPMIKDHANLIVARTFSKNYGMAGLRCGYGIAQKETAARMRQHQMFDSVNCMALAASIASLNDPDQVTNGRRLNTEVKTFVTRELDTMGYKSIPSHANFIMFDLKRPVVPVIQAMKQRNVEVGRLFPALPNHMRLTIGKRAEMEAFLAAFRAVTA
jgi:histidinol-phosphate aminotransferase